MEMTLDLLVLLTTISVYLMNMDFRYSFKKIITIFVIFGIISFTVFLLMINYGFSKDLSSLICFSVPSLILCFLVSKYRDARFIFTFSTIDLIGFVVVIIGKIISVPFNDNQTLTFVSTTILLIIYVIGSLKFRQNYLNILRSVKDGWIYSSIATIMIYIFTFVLIGYPTTIYSRREYIPTIVVYLLLIGIIFKVIYESARNNIKIYVEEIEKENLEMKLELNGIYYNLAYKDKLSGLKNRNAFEEYIKKREADVNENITCISIDIDNLKVLNDNIGHYAGDNAIKNLGQILREVFDKEENIFRIGGDEFIVIVDNYDEKMIEEKLIKMEVFAEKIREKTNTPFEYSKGKCFGKANDVRNIIKEADKEMYKEKSIHKALFNEIL